MSARLTPRRRTLATLVVGAMVTALAVVAVPGILPASADRTTLTYGYSDSVQTLVVPDGITQLTVSMLGAEGGLGGSDWAAPLWSGYRGAVTGTLAVTPGDVLTFGVGHGGGGGQSQAGSAQGGSGGSNPIPGYNGGTGGVAGWEGSSGGGAGGGAATVLQVGNQTIVAGGGGGGGGSGLYNSTAGRPGASTFTASADPTTGVGQDGLSVTPGCIPQIRCDGGASGAGGGGAIGGGPGQIAYGAGDSTEYFGYGGSPGSNDATGLTSASSTYQFYGDDFEDGSITIIYDTSAPTAPSGVSATPADGSATVRWLPPLSDGGGEVADYAVQYAPDSADPEWQDYSRDASTATSTTISGLTDGTDYVFRVAAINAFGTSDYSDPSSPTSVSTVPDAPTLDDVSASDGTLTASFTPAPEVAGVSGTTDYQYRINGGSWVDGGMYSPFVIGSLDNGTDYSVAVRAINPIGPSSASNTVSGKPIAIPSAPTITSISPGIGSATITFSPGYTGGSAITGYSYELNGAPFTPTGSDSNTFTISRLTNGMRYVVFLRAESDAGDGVESTGSYFTTPAAPAAPTIGAITAGDGTLGVDFTLGGNGGLAVDTLYYQVSTGGAWTAASSLSSPLELTGLTNGTAYQISLYANNAAGAGDTSNVVTGTPITTPGAPVLLDGSVAGGDQELDATFTAPATDGGTAIDGYEYSTDGGVTWRGRADGTTASPLVITTQSDDGSTPLVNGTTYPVEVRAVNSVGAGTSSGVAEGIARTVPDAPTLTSVLSRPGALRVSFAVASNGGSPISSYEYRVGASGWISTGTLGQAFTIPSLTDGTRYGVQVRAVNAVGPGAASATVNGTPSSQPGQPTITSITPGNGSLLVGASLASSGGGAITSWQYSTDNGATWATASGLGGPFTITTRSTNGATLVNGTSYAVSLRAVNAAGIGAASSSQVGIPLSAPAAPAVTVTPQNSSLSVSYTAGNTGGSSITGVQYSVGSGWVTVGSLGSTFTIGSLANGSSYPVQVRLINVVGAGAASDVVSSTPRTVPSAPVAVTAAPDGGQATVGWLAPSSDGGSPVTGYTATAWSSASNGSAVASCTTSDTSCVITGLSNGISYFVSVTATNAAGDGPASAPRTAVVPLAKPGAPSIYALVPSNTYLNVYYNDGDTGSYPTTGLEYRVNGGDWAPTATGANPLTISGLTNGSSYTVELRDVNIVGAGPASEPATATPFGEPDVPDASLITTTSADNVTTVNWVAPNDNGSSIYEYNVVAWSSAVQGYQVNSCEAWSGETSCSMFLWDGGQFYITVDATNEADTTARSTPRVEVTPGVPGAVTDLSGASGDGQVDLSWMPSSADGDDFAGYTVWYAPAGTADFTQFGDVWSDPDVVVDGLSNGSDYTFEVFALSAWGSSPGTTSGTYTPLNDGAVPAFTTPVREDGGFTSNISNFDSSASYTVVTNAGHVARSGDTITVSGLASGQSARVVVTVTPIGVGSSMSEFVGRALQAGAVPAFGTPVRTVDGYTVHLRNPAPGVTYTPTVTDGEVAFDGTTLTVTGLAPGATATVTLGAAKDGFTSTSADVTASALDTGTAPLLGVPVSTADGYTVTLLNPDETGSYVLSATPGSASQSGNVFTVSGLDPGQSSTLTATALRPGYTGESSTADASALWSGADLTTGPMYQFADGFSVPLPNYDPAFDYQVTTDAGILSFLDGTITVTGLDVGEVATVTIRATQSGHRAMENQIAGNPYPVPGTAPEFTAPVATATGYTTTVSNYSVVSEYTVTVDAGQVSQVGALVTVTGLTPSQSATVTDSVDRYGWFTASSTVLGTSLAAVAPRSTPTTPGTPDAPAASQGTPPLVAADSAQTVTSAVQPQAKPTPARTGSVWVPFWIGVLVVLVVLGLGAAWLRRRIGLRITRGA